MRFTKILILVLIFFTAAFLRLYQLGVNPSSLDWDEASLGWNAFSILETGTDEYGKAWPVSLQSFNDYKPSLYAFAAIPSIAIFGLNEFSVRLPSAIAGILTVVATYFLVKELTKLTKLTQLTSFLLAISPWHIQFSRAAFEANLALFFFVLGATFLIYFLNHQKRFYFLFSLTCFLFSIYSYHSSRVVIPFFLVGMVIYYRQIFLNHKKLLLVSCFLFLVGLYPLARNTLHTGSLSARYQTVAAKPDPKLILRNYLRHFNFDFLFLSGDNQNRHHAPDMGLLYLWEFPFLLAGIYYLIKDRPKFLLFLAIWFFTAPMASPLANDSPHAVRSLLFLPTFQIVTAFGLLKSLRVLRSFKLVVFLLAVVNVFYFLHQYFVHLPIETAKNWQFGYKEAVQKVVKLENNYDRIYITTRYDQPYIYFLFYGRVSPIIKNNGFFYSGFDKYEFSLAKINHNGLYVISPDDKISNFKPFDQINFPDDSTAFLFGTIKQ